MLIDYMYSYIYFYKIYDPNKFEINFFSTLVFLDKYNGFDVLGI